MRLSSRNRSSHVWDFNPRTPVGCDSRLQAAGTACTFQSTHPSGVRLHVRCEFVNLRVFQSTHPSGVRRTSAYTVDLLDDISIHAPQWGATVDIDVLLLDQLISIHAPQWGATGHGTPTDQQVRISIHAPQWGATILGGLLQQSGVNFNPRTPVGCDAIASAPPLLTTLFQSTHPSGVRQDRRLRISAPSEFQSTHPSGVRLSNSNRRALLHKFQSTHPSGVRLGWITPNVLRRNFNPRTPVGCDDRIPVAESRLTDFNPRTPVGCDDLAAKVTHVVGISIHAPQWGATNRGYGLPIDGGISIHAPQWGATGAAMKNTGQNTNFNPRTPVGCDGQVKSVAYPKVHFNPRTPVGCDDNNKQQNKRNNISIHAPQWGATVRPGLIVSGDIISIHAPQWGATSQTSRVLP